MAIITMPTTTRIVQAIFLIPEAFFQNDRDQGPVVVTEFEVDERPIVAENAHVCGRCRHMLFDYREHLIDPVRVSEHRH